jgi:hypothetical protein
MGVVGFNFLIIWEVFSNVCIIKFGVVVRIPYILVLVTLDIFIRMKSKFVWKPIYSAETGKDKLFFHKVDAKIW